VGFDNFANSLRYFGNSSCTGISYHLASIFHRRIFDEILELSFMCLNTDGNEKNVGLSLGYKVNVGRNRDRISQSAHIFQPIGE
jgi:hypothetical protein